MPLICIHCNVNMLISKTQSNMNDGKFRHICRRHNYIIQLLSIGVISLYYIRSKDNITNSVTK